MNTLSEFGLYESARALPILVLSYAMLMMHYVFSRAFRDSAWAA